MSYNWYKIKKYLYSNASLKSSELPYIQAQVLLSEISKKMPESHPLKNKAYYAGGAVRDELLGNVPKDLDIVVEYPQGGISFAFYISKLLNLREPVIYPTFGTAQLKLKDVIFDGVEYNVDGIELEFVQTRKEQYHEESRKPEVSFGTLKEDVYRRDFTVNSLLKKIESGPSLSMDQVKQKINNGDILDLTGMGIKDMQSGIIQTPLTPDIIFSEDPLRMLRAIRFSVRYNWKMTDDVIKGIKMNIHRLSAVSNERIRDELDKISKYRKIHEAIPLMNEVGLLNEIMPEMYDLIGVEQDETYHSEGDAYAHTLGVIRSLEEDGQIDISLPLIWAAIAHDWGKLSTQERKGDRIHFYGHEDISVDLVENRMRQLKYPNDIINKTIKLVKNHMKGHQAEQWSSKAYRKFHREMGEDYDDIMALLKADEEASIPKSGERESNYKRILETIPQLSVDQIPEKPILNGNEILNMLREKNQYIKPGPVVGRIMEIQTDLLLEKPNLSNENILISKENMRRALEEDPRYQEILNQLPRH